MEALLWVVHPDHRRFYCYASPDEATILNETAVLDGGEMLPGFQLPLRNLFRRTSGAHPTA